jgi:cbb3-type cytochrome oxidase cytochrome c subunit
MLGFYLDEEIQADIMDPKSGLDLKVKATQAKGKSALDLSVDVARSSSPLSKDVDEMNKWLQSVPDDIMPLYRFNTKTESEIEDILNKWLEAGSPSSFASDGSYTDKSSEKKLDLVDKLESELKQDKKKKSPVVDLDAAPKKTMSLDAAFEDLEKD